MSPIAPGTVGSLAALPPAFALAYFGGFWAVAAAAILLYFVGVWATAGVIKSTGLKDPQIVVIDEVVGILIAILPVAAANGAIWMYGAAFLLFRLFDSAKPWPVSYFDKRVPGAHGVMLDDVAAGIMAAAVLYVICNM